MASASATSIFGTATAAGLAVAVAAVGITRFGTVAVRETVGVGAGDGLAAKPTGRLPRDSTEP